MEEYQRVIEKRRTELTAHPIYKELTDIESLKIFMSYHVYAVRDFMDLLKKLQANYASSDSPWNAGLSTSVGRFITEIVLDEQFDIGPEDEIISHYHMYLKGMDELGVEPVSNDLPAVKGFRGTNERITRAGPLSAVTSFYYGREKLIPEMFQEILDSIDQKASKYLTHYLKRHIECDEEDHGPRALEMLEHEMGKFKDSHPYPADEEVIGIALRSLDNRERYWDYIYGIIKRKKYEQQNKSRGAK